MKSCYSSPSDHAKELLVDVFKDIAIQTNATLTEEHVRKIEEAVDHIITEVSV